MIGSALLAAGSLVVKATLVFLVGALLTGVLRRRSAAARHLVWTLTLGGAVALVALAPLTPPLELNVPAEWANALQQQAGALPGGQAASAEPRAGDAARAANPSGGPQGAAVADSEGVDAAASRAAVVRAAVQGIQTNQPSAALALAQRALQAAAPLWLAGLLLVTLWYAGGHLGLARLGRRATPIGDHDPTWRGLLAETTALSGVNRPVRLLRSAAVRAPMTWGFFRPVVVLPTEATGWPAERRRAVLLHELAHVARHDFLLQIVASAACALYWFHPAAWMAARRLRRESERACDDHALACGTPAPDYAGHLLSVACAGRAPRLRSAVAIGMAQRSTLEDRLLSVLDDTVARSAVSGRTRAAGAAVLALALLPLAAVTPVLRAVALVNNVEAPDVERTLDAAPGERLVLDLESGASVSIRGWDEAKVEVRAWNGGRDGDDVRWDVERKGGGIEVQSTFARHRGSQSTSCKVEVRVPRRFDVSLTSSGGDLRLYGLEGTFRGQTGGGDLVLDHLRGAAHLSTGGGDIRVRDSHLEGSVSTGGGEVDLTRVDGPLSGSSGSSRVHRHGGSESEGDGEGESPGEGHASSHPDSHSHHDADSHHDAKSHYDADSSSGSGGFLRIEKAGGGVNIAEAPGGAVIHTGGGKVKIGRAGGLVEAKTGGGDIEIGPVAGSVHAGTGGGNIHVIVADAGGREQTVELTSGNGRMILELPPGFDGTVELETAYTNNHRGGATRIESAWDLQRSATSEWESLGGQTPRRYVRAKGKIGNGRGLVRVRTVNGDIELRRGPG
jgi:beta-lactamase regulating signal transducer with metallopeptidase domain/DUF4097 and DUF4098 domain-containing protein YvlB